MTSLKFLPPSKRIGAKTEYSHECCHCSDEETNNTMLSSSNSTKTLNLRYKPVSQELLDSCCDVEKLWIGPRLDMAPSLVIQSLPTSLEHLDWDMTDSTNTIDGDILKELFRKTSLKHLCLRFRGDEGAVLLSQHLHNASLLLESLDLRGNSIGNVGVQALASVLHESSITSLNLGYNRIGNEGVEALSKVLSDSDCKLRYLNLSCNVFGQEGANHLAFSLRKNTSLQELSLFCNHIPHDSCIEFAATLEHSNVTLQHLKLGGTLTDVFSDIRVKIDYFLKLNQNGRSILQKHDLEEDEWWQKIVQANGDLDVLLFFLSNKPELLVHADARTTIVEQL